MSDQYFKNQNDAYEKCCLEILKRLDILKEEQEIGSGLYGPDVSVFFDARNIIVDLLKEIKDDKYKIR